jgi:hypothetical protein
VQCPELAGSEVVLLESLFSPLLRRGFASASIVLKVTSFDQIGLKTSRGHFLENR